MGPLLRSNLEIVPAGGDRYLVLDPGTGQRFEFGLRERNMADLLDGNRDTDEILHTYRRRFEQDLERAAVETFLDQLRTLGLLQDTRGPAGAIRDPSAGPNVGYASPVPLTRSDPAARINHGFDWLAAAAGWVLHPVWLIPVAGLTLFALQRIWNEADRFMFELELLAQQYSMMLLVLLIVVRCVCLTLPRELLVGAACRQFGGRVRGFRLTFYHHCIPTFWCDTGDSIAFMDRRGQWTLATLRLWTHLAFTGFSFLLWSTAGPGSELRTFWLALFVPSAVGLLLHLNVFMVSDAYGALSTWLAAPKLRERALAETRAWLTMRPSAESISDRARFWMRAYGLGIILWKILATSVVVVVGAIWMTKAYHGIGALIWLTAVVWWFQEPIGRTMMGADSIRWLVRGGGSKPIRWLIRLIVLAALIGCAWIPYDHEIGGDCQIFPQAQHGARAQIADEVEQVHVREGQWVEPGALIATLAARDERAAVLTTKAELAKARDNLALLKAGNRPEDIAIARQEVALRQVELAHYEFNRKQSKEIAETQIEVARQEVKLREIEYEHAKYEWNSVEELAKEDQAPRREVERTQTNMNRALQALAIARETLLRTGEAAALDTARAESQHKTALEELAIARQNLQRVESGARPEEIQAAEAEVLRLTEVLAHHEEILKLRHVTSPIQGRIITPNVKLREGQFVTPGELIAVVQDTSSLHAEVAADEAAAVHIKEGMTTHLRLRGLDGHLVTGKVLSVASETLNYGELGADQIRTDRETRLDEALHRDEAHFVRVKVELDRTDQNLIPGMTGYARIVVSKDRLWSALYRPVARFLRVEAWSWLP